MTVLTPILSGQPLSNGGWGLVNNHLRLPSSRRSPHIFSEGFLTVEPQQLTDTTSQHSWVDFSSSLFHLPQLSHFCSLLTGFQTNHLSQKSLSQALLLGWNQVNTPVLQNVILLYSSSYVTARSFSASFAELLSNPWMQAQPWVLHSLWDLIPSHGFMHYLYIPNVFIQGHFSPNPHSQPLPSQYLQKDVLIPQTSCEKNWSHFPSPETGRLSLLPLSRRHLYLSTAQLKTVDSFATVFSHIPYSTQTLTS